MQTIQFQVKDAYVQNVLNMLESMKGILLENIELKDKITPMDDPYFHQRKAELEKTIKAVNEGSMKMYDFDKSMDTLISKLEN